MVQLHQLLGYGQSQASSSITGYHILSCLLKTLKYSLDFIRRNANTRIDDLNNQVNPLDFRII